MAEGLGLLDDLHGEHAYHTPLLVGLLLIRHCLPLQDGVLWTHQEGYLGLWAWQYCSRLGWFLLLSPGCARLGIKGEWLRTLISGNHDEKQLNIFKYF